MSKQKILNQKRKRRVARTRAKIFGTSTKPRLAVFRSNRFIYAQLIDDEKGRTLASASSRKLKPEEKKKSKTEQASLIGEALAKEALKLGIQEAVFDRRAYSFHGRIRTLALGVRKNGIKI